MRLHASSRSTRPSWAGRSASLDFVARVAVVLLAAGIVYLASPCRRLPTVHAAAQQPKLLDAPELIGGTDWFNTDKPIRLEDLRGRIVLLDFWTLCCINCIHTLPDLATIEARYPGIVVVIGVHTPKFDNEKKTASVLKAVLRYEIKHPVINDADAEIWKTCSARPMAHAGAHRSRNGKFRGASATGEGHLKARGKESIKTLIKEFEPTGKLKEDADHLQADAPRTRPAGSAFPATSWPTLARSRLFIADSTNHRIVIADLDGKKLAVAGSGAEGLKDGARRRPVQRPARHWPSTATPSTSPTARTHAIPRPQPQGRNRQAGRRHRPRSTICWQGGHAGPARKIALASPWDILLHNKRIYIAMAGHNNIWTFDLVKDTVATYAGDAFERHPRTDRSRPLASLAPPGWPPTANASTPPTAEPALSAPLPLFGNGGTINTHSRRQGPLRVRRLDSTGRIRPPPQLRPRRHLLSKASSTSPTPTTARSKSSIPPNTPATPFSAGPNVRRNEPGGLSIAAGKMYIADTNNHRIQIVDMKTKDVSTLQLEGVAPGARAEVGSGREKK